MKIFCPTCNKSYDYTFDAATTQAIAERNKNKNAWLKLPAYIRELFITGMCYKCVSETFHVSTPGYNLGEEVGECVECGCTLYKSDIEKDRCPSCYAKLSEMDNYA